MRAEDEEQEKSPLYQKKGAFLFCFFHFAISVQTP